MAKKNKINQIRSIKLYLLLYKMSHNMNVRSQSFLLFKLKRTDCEKNKKVSFNNLN